MTEQDEQLAEGAANTSQIRSLSALIAAGPLALRFQIALPFPDSIPLLIPLEGAAATGDTGDMGMFCMDCHLE